MKYISLILITSIIHYSLGCYNKKVIKNNEEYQTYLNKKNEIYVRTEFGEEYYFDTNNYKFNNDTIQGESQEVIGLNLFSDPSYTKIASKDIVQIKIVEFDIETFVVGTVFMIGILYYYYYVSEIQTDNN